MKTSWIILFSACLLLSSCHTEVKQPVDANNIQDYLEQAASAITTQSLAGMHNLDDWKKVRQDRYWELAEMLGIADLLRADRTPLNVKVTGTVQGEGYHIEKLYYESLPGLFVRANLYIPDGLKKRAPAVLYVCGHAPTQKVHYQAHPRKFAQLGFVCLIIETVQYGEVQGEHWGCYARGWFNWYSRGYTPGGVECWDAIRGLDLLSQRTEVDTSKMGVTGISGGGAQSWYIAAMDPRIRAAAPVCGASSLKAQITTRTVDGHCDCMTPVNTYRIDFSDIGALIAPRPLLIGQADRDGLNQIESVEGLLEKIRKVYGLYQADGSVSLVETPGGHSYHKISREKIFSFFIKNLMGKEVSPEEAGDIETDASKLFPYDTLKVFADGPPAGNRSTTIQDSFISLNKPAELTGEAGRLNWRDSVVDFLMVRTFGAFPAQAVPFDEKLVFQTLDNARCGQDLYSFRSEEGWRLKTEIRWEHAKDSVSPLTIVLRSAGDAPSVSESFGYEVAAHQNTAYFEARGVGENGWAPELAWHVRRAAAWTGRTVASMQVYDVLRCIAFCRTVKGVDRGRISLAAEGDMAVVALYAALIDGKCAAVIIKNPPETQDAGSSPDGRGQAIEMLNCLRITDVYQIPALLYPAQVKFVGTMPQAYKWSEDLLTKLGYAPFDRIITAESAE
jgi:dienelactone hydrolase